MPEAGKLEWDDDLAVLWVEYGATVTLEAMTWMRQNATKRPLIPEIRERCRIIRESKAPRGHRSSDPRAYEPYGSFEAYDRAVREHLANPDDDRFIPIELIERDAAEFFGIRAKALASGDPIRRADIREWWLWRGDATDREWREARAAGRIKLQQAHRAMLDQNAELASILQDIP